MIKFYSKVKKIEQRKRLVAAWKDELGDIKTEHENMGWFMLLEGSWESLYVGDDAPEGFKEGDEVEVLIKGKS